MLQILSHNNASILLFRTGFVFVYFASKKMIKRNEVLIMTYQHTLVSFGLHIFQVNRFSSTSIIRFREHFRGTYQQRTTHVVPLTLQRPMGLSKYFLCPGCLPPYHIKKSKDYSSSYTIVSKLFCYKCKLFFSYSSVLNRLVIINLRI